MQPYDSRRTVESAEHHHDPPVLADVSHRLGPTADHVQVGDRVVVEHPQRPDRPLRRHVHVPVRVKRRRSDEEQRLLRDPLALVLVDAVVDLAHRVEVSSATEGESGRDRATAVSS
jgi:hypothetical protein